jgi:hypothetical protein
MVGQILAGAGQPFFLNVPTHYSDKWFSASSRVSATALMSLSNAIGAAIGELVTPFMASEASDIPNMVVRSDISDLATILFNYRDSGKCTGDIYTVLASHSPGSVEHGTEVVASAISPSIRSESKLLVFIHSRIVPSVSD